MRAEALARAGAVVAEVGRYTAAVEVADVEAVGTKQEAQTNEEMGNPGRVGALVVLDAPPGMTIV